MNTNLLKVPFRLTNPIDLGESLNEIIKRDYFQSASIFEDDLSTCTKSRNEIQILNSESVNEYSIDLIKSYYNLLDNLTIKFPDDHIRFEWFGTLGYRPTGPFNSRSLKYEQYNVIYQLGSLYCQLALLESRYSDEGLKKSCLYFQYASGCFDLLHQKIELEFNKNNYRPLKLPADFQPATLLCLKYIMLAQAQEAIWQKAIGNTSMKDSVIAKLSIQTSEYYSIASSKGFESDIIKQDWINHTTVKSHHFKAAAHYRISKTCLETFKYGEQIAHLKLASKNCDLADKSTRYVNEFVIEDLKGLNETIKTSLRVAEKDNDLIYLKLVPDEQDISFIQGVSMVKSISPELNVNNKKKQFFSELIPFVIVQVAQAFRERLDTYINDNLIIPLQSLNKLIHQFITDRNLPASIDSIQNPESLPESIIQHSKEIMSMGGIKVIDTLLKEIDRLTIVSYKILEACQQRLVKDSEEDDILKSKSSSTSSSSSFSTNLDRPSSEIAGAHLVTRINKMREYLTSAKSGDDIIHQEYTEVKPLINIYCTGYDGLINYIPQTTFTELNQEINQIISNLRDSMSQIDIYDESRKSFLSELEIKARENSILPIILDKYKSNKDEFHNEEGKIDPNLFESIYEEHLKIFQIDIEFINKQKQNQTRLENEIDSLNNKFVSVYTNTNNESQTNRRIALQNLEQAYSKYLQLISDLNEGLKFYTGLINNGNGVLRDCESFVNQRRIEARDLEIKLNNQYDDTFATSNQTNELEINNNEQIKDLQRDMNTNTILHGVAGTWNPSQGIKFE